MPPNRQVSQKYNPGTHLHAALSASRLQESSVPRRADTTMWRMFITTQRTRKTTNDSTCHRRGSARTQRTEHRPPFNDNAGLTGGCQCNYMRRAGQETGRTENRSCFEKYIHSLTGKSRHTNRNGHNIRTVGGFILLCDFLRNVRSLCSQSGRWPVLADSEVTPWWLSR